MEIIEHRCLKIRELLHRPLCCADKYWHWPHLKVEGAVQCSRKQGAQKVLGEQPPPPPPPPAKLHTVSDMSQEIHEMWLYTLFCTYLTERNLECKQTIHIMNSGTLVHSTLFTAWLHLSNFGKRIQLHSLELMAFLHLPCQEKTLLGDELSPAKLKRKCSLFWKPSLNLSVTFQWAYPSLIRSVHLHSDTEKFTNHTEASVRPIHSILQHRKCQIYSLGNGI